VYVLVKKKILAHIVRRHDLALPSLKGRDRSYVISEKYTNTFLVFLSD
jgi:hypothetical protein